MLQLTQSQLNDAVTGNNSYNYSFLYDIYTNEIKDSIESNVDAFITSDFKYHNFFEADNKAILIDIGHYESEKHIKLFIKEFLNKKLPNFTVLLSEQNINPVNYY